jgi:hypothetical protein
MTVLPSINKLILYFQKIIAPDTLEKFLDRAVRAMQKHKRFASKKDGIIAVDDSTFEKTGKNGAYQHRPAWRDALNLVNGYQNSLQLIWLRIHEGRTSLD